MTMPALFAEPRRAPRVLRAVDGSSSRRRSVLTILGMGAALWVTSQWIVGGDFKSLILGGLAFAMVVVAFSVLKNWRSGFYLFLVWLLFEDLARKYLGNGTVLFFGKDVLLAIICCSFFMEQRRRPAKLFSPPFLGSLCIFVLLAVAQVFNPNSPSILYGLLGLKIYFYYVPLMFLGYALLRDEADLDRFLVINVVLAALIAGLGIIQAIRGPDFLNPTNLAPELNLGRLTRESPLTHLEILRPSSIFVSAGRFNAYMIQAFILGFGATVHLFLRRSPVWRLVLGALSVVTIAAAMGGSRGCAVWVGASAILLSAAATWGHSGLSSKDLAMRSVVRRALVVLVVGLLLSAWVFPERLKAYFAVYSESLDPRNPESDLVDRLWGYPLGNLESAFSQPNWLIGNGTGTASLGAKYVARFLGTEQPNIGVEEGFGTLMLELGIIAPFLWLWWTFSAAGSCLKTALKTKGSNAFPLACALFWFIFHLLVLQTWGGIAQYENFVSNAYVWLLIGVLFRLPTLAQFAIEHIEGYRLLR